MIREVLTHYQKCLADIRLLNDMKTIKQYCWMQHVQAGICAYCLFSENFISNLLVNFIARIPISCVIKEQVICAFQIRIDYLKSRL